MNNELVTKTNPEPSEAEKNFINAVKKWAAENKDAVFSVAAAMSAAKLDQIAKEIKQHMYTGNTSSLGGLQRQVQASNNICLLKTGSTLLKKGMPTLAIGEAFITDIKKQNP